MCDNCLMAKSFGRIWMALQFKRFGEFLLRQGGGTKMLGGLAAAFFHAVPSKTGLPQEVVSANFGESPADINCFEDVWCYDAAGCVSCFRTQRRSTTVFSYFRGFWMHACHISKLIIEMRHASSDLVSCNCNNIIDRKNSVISMQRGSAFGKICLSHFLTDRIFAKMVQLKLSK